MKFIVVARRAKFPLELDQGRPGPGPSELNHGV